MAQHEELTVDGFIFANANDTELAKNEIRKIAYIEAHSDLSNMEIVKVIYEQAIENRTFQTPIGYEFLRDLQKALIASKMMEEPKAIPLYTTFKRINLSDETTIKTRVTKAEKKEDNLKSKYRSSLIVSGIMVCLVVILFLITMFGTTPNILNYKRAITNQYSAWEQDLTQREAVIRQRERELNIYNEK